MSYNKARLRTMTDHLTWLTANTPALGAMISDPSWPRLLAELEGYDRHSRALADERSVHIAADVTGPLRNALLDDSLPPSIRKSIAVAVTRAEVLRTEAEQLDVVHGLIAGDLQQVASASKRSLYAGVNARLQEALDAASALDLDEITDAEDAITAGKEVQWRQVAEMHRDYLAARGLHRSLLVAEGATGLDASSYFWFSHFGGLAVVWPHWLRSSITSNQAGWTATFAACPWPEDPTSIDHFRFVVRHRDQLKPWCPTREQVETTWNLERIVARETYDAEAEHVARGGTPPTQAELLRYASSHRAARGGE